MNTVQSVLIVIVRIVVAYVVAACVASLSAFLLVAAVTMSDPRIEGMTLGEELTNQAGFLPLVAILAAVLAAPIAVIAILISEIRHIDHWWFFSVAGLLAAIPALFRGDFLTPIRMAEDFVTLGPIGALAGLTYWLVRFRLWSK